jgi:hypothetical protein
VHGIADIDRSEIERRRETVRRVWEYRKADHIPIGVWLDDFSRYSLREQCENGLIQFEVNVGSIDRCLRCLPDDYIPCARVWPGYMTIGTVFGIPLHWSDNPNQAPGLKEHPIRDMEQVRSLHIPDPEHDGLMPHNLRWLRYFSENLPKDVHLAGIDLGGPMNTVKDLLDTNLLYTAFYDNPLEYHILLERVTDLQIRCYEAVIRAVGGINRLAGIDFDPLWAPEGLKGFVSDDVCASFGPDTFREFSLPYNNLIFQRFGGGRIHNCGPHPSLGLYLGHSPEIRGLNCSWRYSNAELPGMKEHFRGRGIVELNFDFGESFEEIVRGYDRAADTLSPDVIAIPLVLLNETWTDCAISELYSALRKISDRYARNIDWKEE